MIFCEIFQNGRHENPLPPGEDDPVDSRNPNSTTVASSGATAENTTVTVRLSGSQPNSAAASASGSAPASSSASTSMSALNISVDNEEGLLSDEVFESSPTQRFLRVTDSVRRLAGNFQSNHNQTVGQAEDGEWVSTSSESGSPSLGNDHVVDDGNLSDGELELSEAVISVNQYVMQPRHFDGNVSTSCKNCNVTFI